MKIKSIIEIVLFFYIALLIGCSSSTIRIESSPEAADVLVNVQGQAPKKMGQTPINLIESTIGAGNEPFQVIVAKEGFQSENILIPATSFSRATMIQIKLKELGSENKALNDQTLQKVAAAVAASQAMIKSKDYDSAERTIQAIAAQYPSIATFHELLGNVYYLKKDLTKALQHYKKAYSLNPGNLDTERMVRKIEDIQSFKSPYGGTQ